MVINYLDIMGVAGLVVPGMKIEIVAYAVIG